MCSAYNGCSPSPALSCAKHLLHESIENAGSSSSQLFPGYTHDRIRQILAIVLPVEKIPAMLELLSWGGTGVFDVQYQPFVRVGHGFLVPVNITRTLNIIRNVMVRSRERLYA